jgi:ectoine hydroxylase-related dioxygenase (phytanoyl-CoA dioxygenase family)
MFKLLYLSKNKRKFSENKMDFKDDLKNQISNNGFGIINDIYSEEEIEKLLEIIAEVDTTKATFRKSKDVFAIRQFFKEVPNSIDLILTKKLTTLISEICGENYFVVKAIYFDKPEGSNWFVPYHQDLTISVDKKLELDGFGPWTTKQNQFAVQPPIEILKNNFTIRIHLDDTNEQNGALKVIPKSHLKQIYRPENIDWTIETEMVCDVPKGGIMFMKPLLLHSSGRTTDNRKRRVIHIEFSNTALPEAIKWAEGLSLSQN